uniref:Uncharacterized protein n=1 Tax=Ailuropoda melanoleuca TaxID=9646 RepID=A0A7N5KCI8_AILME
EGPNIISPALPRRELKPWEGGHLLRSHRGVGAEPGLELTSVRAKWRLEPGAPGIPSGTLSLYGCLPRGWQGGWSPGSRAGGLFHPPTFPSLPRRELELLGTWGREGFRGPWVGVARRCVQGPQ